MIHKWSEEGRDEQAALFTRWVGILVAFVLCALIVVAAQRMIANAQRKVQKPYVTEMGNEYISSPEAPLNSGATAAGSPAYPDARAQRAAFASGQPVGAAPLPGAAFAAVPLSSPVLPPAFVSSNSAFAVDSQRREAAASLMPLRELMLTVKEFDSKTVSEGFAAGGGSGPATPNIAFADGRDEGAMVAADMTQETNQRRGIQRILDLSDGIEGMLLTYSHPDNFAPPLKDGVGEVARELHTYLATVRNAAALPDRREELRALASKRLALAEQALQALGNITGGVGIGSAAN